MNPAARSSITWVWLILVGLTGGSWVLGTQDAAGRGGLPVTAAILALASFKVHLVIRHFMEVKEAPRVLKLACGAWIVVLLAALLALYA